MAIVLTNGKCYITTNRKGGIVKTPTVEDAQTFCNVNVAMQKIFKSPGRCKGYYPYDTENTNKCGGKKKRKNYSKEERKFIYDKSKGHCELCGQQILLEDMTLDHIVPLSMGGEDSVENLQAACATCNKFKSNILPDDFLGRIIKIFLYQMEKKCDKDMKIRLIHKLLECL